jgi:hypothetical protein
MEQWEYLHLKLLPEEIVPALDQHGLNGWELASMIVLRYELVTFSLSNAYEPAKFTAVLKRKRVPYGDVQ